MTNNLVCRYIYVVYSWWNKNHLIWNIILLTLVYRLKIKNKKLFWNISAIFLKYRQLALKLIKTKNKLNSCK